MRSGRQYRAPRHFVTISDILAMRDWLNPSVFVWCDPRPPQTRSKTMSNGIQAADPQMQVSTVSERLEREEKVLTERLEKVRELRAALAGNPETAAIIDGLSSLGHVNY